jgi:DNA-binding FadR family transcriptional regulator
MPETIRARGAARAAVFAPLDGSGRAALVEQRLADAIVLGLLGPGERLPSESELARRFGVATVTAREALESLRDKGLLETRRGRGGGSFVQPLRDLRPLVDSRLRALSRVELRDMGVHYGALAATAAELAAERSTAEDVEAMARLVASFGPADEGSARRRESTFRLEVAALAQSARLVREHVRLQAEFGPLLSVGFREPGMRDKAVGHYRAVIGHLAEGDADAARRAVKDSIAEAVEVLIDAKVAADGRAR